MPDDDSGSPPAGKGGLDPDERYRRRIGITLAVLAVLGAWIAVLNRNAGANESNLARESTRLASEAATAAVISNAIDQAVEQTTIEARALVLDPVFTAPDDIAAAAGVTLDPQRSLERVAQAEQDLRSTFGGQHDLALEEKTRARRLALRQDETVLERSTWNSRASQYETVITVLAVAIFLVGFTAVVSRKVRPPLVVPGLLLAVYCFGWAIFIYNKPIPSVPEKAIDATGKGDALVDVGSPDPAFGEYTTAIDADDDYLPAVRGRALAAFNQANPDLFTTLAFTDSSSEMFDQAVADAKRSLDIGGDEDVVNLTVAGYIAIAANEYDLAADFLAKAVEINDLTPGVHFALSAVEVARGNEDAAKRWREKAVAELGPLQATDALRGRAAAYYTLLEWVADQVPDQADLAAEIETETILGETEITAGNKLAGQAPPDADFEIVQARFADDQTTIQTSSTGIPDGATITLVVYERPKPDGAWVQPSELFYAGPAGRNGGGVTLDTPRACDPVEYRFDLYVEGVLVGSKTAPGVKPTC